MYDGVKINSLGKGAEAVEFFIQKLRINSSRL